MSNFMMFEKSQMQDRAGEVADMLSALSNPYRLMIMCRLVEGECNVTTLVAEVALSQSAVSQHLGKLRDAGMVATRRESQSIHYRIADERVRAVMEVLYQQYCG